MRSKLPYLILIISIFFGEAASTNYFNMLAWSPNPFNSGTIISFNLVEPMEVKIAIYDLLGREIQTLIDDFRQAGAHTVYFGSAGLCSGMYFYRLYVGDVVETKRMVLLK